MMKHKKMGIKHKKMGIKHKKMGILMFILVVAIVIAIFAYTASPTPTNILNSNIMISYGTYNFAKLPPTPKPLGTTFSTDEICWIAMFFFGSIFGLCKMWQSTQSLKQAVLKNTKIIKEKQYIFVSEGTKPSSTQITTTKNDIGIIPEEGAMKLLNEKDEYCRNCHKRLTSENKGSDEYPDLCRECEDSEQEEDDGGVLF